MIDLSLLQNLSSASVLVVGDVMLDRYYNGDSQRISPEAPVPVVKISKIEDKAGGAANVARNIAHLDGKAGLLGIIGDDSAGTSLQQLLAGEQIHSELVSQQHKPTIAKIRVVSRQQQIVRLDQEETFSAEDAQRLAEHFAAVYQQYDVIAFSDYNKGSLQQIAGMITLAKAAGKTVLVDPKQTDLSVYAGADVITPNLGEFRAAGGKTGSVEDMLSSARKLMQDAGLASILLTRSEQGMSLITADEHFHFPAQVLEVSDVTGAGDTVIATLAVMLSAGMSLHDATQLANLAAGIVVGKVGAATVSPEELAAKLNKDLFRQGDFYQTPFDKVLQHIRFARQSGERIVFTNGCFDILHLGHVTYMAQAAELGDVLVIGMNSDQSVRNQGKGPERPVNPEKARGMLLAALGFVDFVVLFEEDPPLRIIQEIIPNILVKGGDYDANETDPLSKKYIVGSDIVRLNKGEVATISLVDGFSTTSTIKRMRGSEE